MQPADIDPSDLLGQLETLERDRCKYVGPSGPLSLFHKRGKVTYTYKNGSIGLSIYILTLSISKAFFILMAKSMEKLKCFRHENSKKDQVGYILLMFKVNQVKKLQVENPRSER